MINSSSTAETIKSASTLTPLLGKPTPQLKIKFHIWMVCCMGNCKICGTPTTGKKQYCDDCRKAKKRAYFNQKYNNDDKFREKHLDRVKIRKSTRTYLGSLYDYSYHARSNFEDEERVVKAIKNKTFNGKKSSYKDDSFGYKANKNYNQAIAFEEERKDSTNVCEICGGDKFTIEDGMIICETCGLCEDIFSMSVFGKPSLKEDNLTRAMRRHYKEGDRNE